MKKSLIPLKNSFSGIRDTIWDYRIRDRLEML